MIGTVRIAIPCFYVQVDNFTIATAVWGDDVMRFTAVGMIVDADSEDIHGVSACREIGDVQWQLVERESAEKLAIGKNIEEVVARVCHTEIDGHIVSASRVAIAYLN